MRMDTHPLVREYFGEQLRSQQTEAWKECNKRLYDRGMGAPEAGLCYERAESLARSLNRSPSLYMVLVGQWRQSLNTGKLSATLRIAKRLYALAQEQNDSSRLIGACAVLALHFAKLSESQRSRSRFGWRNAQKQPTQNTAAKKRAGWEDVDFDYLFNNAQSGNLSFCLPANPLEPLIKSPAEAVNVSFKNYRRSSAEGGS